MPQPSRFIATLAAVAVTGCVLFAQEPEPQAPAGGGRGQGAGQAPGRGGRPPDGFAQFIRPLASQDVLVRGKSLYDGNCASCHALDLRGVLGKGGNLMRSQGVMSDERSERIGPHLTKHNPPFNFVRDDVTAISEYLHSLLATMGPQGSPPGRNPTGLKLNVLVGDPAAGKVYFDSHCASCHSVSGDLRGIGAKYDDPRALQNAWVVGLKSNAPVSGAGATVTMANGQKLQGQLVRRGDFLVVLTLPDGTRRSIPIENGVKVDVDDPQAAHKKMVIELDDPENKNMHDVTAYLSTVR